jgi:hypothetical protein
MLQIIHLSMKSNKNYIFPVILVLYSFVGGSRMEKWALILSQKCLNINLRK